MALSNRNGTLVLPDGTRLAVEAVRVSEVPPQYLLKGCGDDAVLRRFMLLGEAVLHLNGLRVRIRFRRLSGNEVLADGDA